jgi:hypothetical protein
MGLKSWIVQFNVKVDYPMLLKRKNGGKGLRDFLFMFIVYNFTSVWD